MRTFLLTDGSKNSYGFRIDMSALKLDRFRSNYELAQETIAALPIRGKGIGAIYSPAVYTVKSTV